MASTTVYRLTDDGPPIPAIGTLKPAANQLFPGGTIVQRDANGRAVSPGTADVSGLPAFMVSAATQDNRTATTQLPFTGLNDGGNVEGFFGSFALAISGTAPVEGQTVYVVDNQTVSIDSLNGTRGIAGICVQVQVVSATITKYYILIGPLAIAAAKASTGAYTRAYLPITSGLVTATGAPMAVAAAGGVAGTKIADTKSAVVQWQPNATPGGVSINMPYPADLDSTQPITLKLDVSKDGATVGDATTFTVTAYDVVPGALADAGANFGGVTNALVGNAATKTVATLSLVFAAAAAHAYPATLALSLTPTAGLLGTDTLNLHSAWLEYTKKPV